jgi:hypothetical protein
VLRFRLRILKKALHAHTTDSVGAYTAAKVPIGEYTVTAEAPGFQKTPDSGITLSVGQAFARRSPAQNRFVFAGGHRIRSVTRVQYETSSMSNVITGKQVSSEPAR